MVNLYDLANLSLKLKGQIDKARAMGNLSEETDLTRQREDILSEVGDRYSQASLCSVLNF